MLTEDTSHQLDHLIPSLQELSTIQHLSKSLSLQLRNPMFSDAKLQDTLGGDVLKSDSLWCLLSKIRRARSM